MKNLIYLFLISILSSCNDNNDTNNNTPAPINASVNGTWKLIKVSGMLSGIEHNFAPGIITWTFDESSQKVTVVNTNANSNLDDVLESGIYSYETTSNPAQELLCVESVKINSENYGCVSFENNQLRIDESYLDGATLDFIK
ncbi:hypothetical protein [Flavobacterium sp.]|uniref:hypothetical protein n=1 Tax=Flavobacterium sp. TaxID=239 RepID=UPI00286E0597|nr:hypothetical protein [Flavobacterium sp.]